MRMLDGFSGDSDALAPGYFALAKFCFTEGWRLPEGTETRARLLARHNQRACAALWSEAV